MAGEPHPTQSAQWKHHFPECPSSRVRVGLYSGSVRNGCGPYLCTAGHARARSISVRDSALRPPSTLQPGDRVCAPSLSRRHHFHGEHRSSISSTSSSNTTDSQVTHCRLTCSSLAVFPEVWQLMLISPFRVSPEEMIKFGTESGRGEKESVYE